MQTALFAVGSDKIFSTPVGHNLAAFDSNIDNLLAAMYLSRNLTGSYKRNHDVVCDPDPCMVDSICGHAGI